MGGTAIRRTRARRGEGDRLRADIVAAASGMLAETGDVGELSLRAVARAVGVATTSLYLHFGQLDELIAAVKRQYFADFGAALSQAALAAGPSPSDRARARATEYVRYGLANWGRYQVMFSSRPVPAHLHPEVDFLGREVFEEVRDELAEVLGPGPEADLVAVQFWTSLHGIVTLRRVRSHFPWPDLERQLDDLTARLLPA